jgi:putative ABC transport system permease protein
MDRRTTAWLKLLVRFAVDGLSGQRGRSLLTMLGMAIGSASVVAVVSIGLLGREYVVSLIEGVGSNLVFAYGVGGAVNPEELSFDDVDAFRARVTGVDAMAPVLDGNEPLSIRGVPESITVLGVTPAYAQVRNLVTLSGRFLNEAEESGGAKVCVISKELALKLYGSTDVGEAWLRIFGLRFRVLGVFREGVESAAALQKSEAAGLVAIIPFSTFRNLSDIRFVDVVYFRAVSPAAVPRVVAQVTDVQPERAFAFEEVRDQLRTGLLRERGIRNLIQDLRRATYIDVRL